MKTIDDKCPRCGKDTEYSGDGSRHCGKCSWSDRVDREIEGSNR